MPAFAQHLKEDLQNHAANDDDINGGSGTRTKYTYVGGGPIGAADPLGLIKYWPADSNASVGRAICDGKDGMTIQPPFLTPDEKKCGIGDCARRHEQIHIIDLRHLDPKVCTAQLRGVIPGFDTTAQRDASEDRAWDETLRCLRAKLKQACGDCKQTIQTWIDWVPEGRRRAKEAR